MGEYPFVKQRLMAMVHGGESLSEQKAEEKAKRKPERRCESDCPCKEWIECPYYDEENQRQLRDNLYR